MVKKPKISYSFADWRKDNPVEADIFDLINAAKSFALSQVTHVGGESGDPEDPPQRFDDTETKLEGAIHRGEKAIHAMMNISQARSAVGLKKRARGKGKSFDPDLASLSDPQVRVVLDMLRGKIEKPLALTMVAQILDPKGDIDQRTLTNYIEYLIQTWGGHADPGLRSLWAQNTDV